MVGQWVGRKISGWVEDVDRHAYTQTSTPMLIHLIGHVFNQQAEYREIQLDVRHIVLRGPRRGESGLGKALKDRSAIVAHVSILYEMIPKFKHKSPIDKFTCLQMKNYRQNLSLQPPLKCA